MEENQSIDFFTLCHETNHNILYEVCFLGQFGRIRIFHFAERIFPTRSIAFASKLLMSCARFPYSHLLLLRGIHDFKNVN